MQGNIVTIFLLTFLLQLSSGLNKLILPLRKPALAETFRFLEIHFGIHYLVEEQHLTHNSIRVRSFGMISITIDEPGSLGS